MTTGMTNNWGNFTNTMKSQGGYASSDTSANAAIEGAKKMLGDSTNGGTNMDGQTRNVSYGGYNITFVNKGGVWRASSWQKVG